MVGRGSIPTLSSSSHPLGRAAVAPLNATRIEIAQILCCRTPLSRKERDVKTNGKAILSLLFFIPSPLSCVVSLAPEELVRAM